MVEVKSATGAKEYHRDDAAIQGVRGPSGGIAVAIDRGRLCRYVLDVSRERRLSRPVSRRGLTAETMARERRFGVGSRGSGGPRFERRAGDIHGEALRGSVSVWLLGVLPSREAPVEFPVSWLPNVRTKKLN